MEERMRQLIDMLNKAANAYYNGKRELMTDFEWDMAFDELRALEEKSGIVFEDSPTHKVSADTDVIGEKENHEFAALSLAKTKSTEELIKYAGERAVWLSWKLDGLTLVATYDGGRLTHLVTRGDGHTGTSIIRLSGAIAGIPDKIDYDGHIVVRGEAIISYDDFNDFITETGETYANPRNLASGSLSLKDIEEVKKRKIRFIPFTLVYSSNEIPGFGARIQFLKENGFDFVEAVKIDDPKTIPEIVNQFTEKVVSGEMKYPVDGLVLTYEDTDYASSGNVTGHHATRAGLAFKWQDESAVSKLTEIEWSCAYSTITPVAIFEPVNLEGTTVKRASLCNISECRRLNIGCAGTEIEVIKANKIIPKIISVKNKVGEFIVPEVCPVCGGKTHIEVSDSETEKLVCENPDCSAKKIRRYSRFVSKKGMNIDGLSEQTVARFINLGWLDNYADFYRLPEHRDEIAALDGFGEKSASNIVDAVNRSRKVSARNFLYSLNIPLCGEDVCKKLLGSYNLNELIETAHVSDDFAQFSSIDGIGPEKSAKFTEFFKNEYNYESVKELLEKVEIEPDTLSSEDGRMTGLTFVVTGEVNRYKNRNELKEYIESCGGKVTGSVTGKTDYLINNDIDSSSSKNKKAKELGVKIISEQQFIEMFG